MMFEIMRYFGLNHRPSSGLKLKLKELRTFVLIYIGNSNIYTLLYSYITKYEYIRRHVMTYESYDCFIIL